MFHYACNLRIGILYSRRPNLKIAKTLDVVVECDEDKG